MTFSHLLLRRFKCARLLSIYPLSKIPNAASLSSVSTATDPTHESPSTPKPTSLSARMSFIFEQIDEIDKKREEKDETLQRIRTWRESKKQQSGSSMDPVPNPAEHDPEQNLKQDSVKSEAVLADSYVKKEVELVHPWPEWIELMERLVHQNYFDHKRKDEDGMMETLGIHLSDSVPEDDIGNDFTRDFKTVQAAMINFGRDRFDILRSLSRQDLQILVGYGCASTDKRVVFSSKLLRKHVHLDEGDVCSSCNLRSSCEKAYLLTNKEDEPRTIDIMRVLLAYGYEPIDGSVTNKSLLKIKSVKTVIRKLLHDVVKLSAVPIDPNLPPPVIKKPPPKVKQPPPPPKKRIGRNDIEMKKGDWLCPKCDFMNFAKNTVCMQCDAKRPKRQLLPGEWECPQCNFLNYRRNTACFHCEHKRPPDTYGESQFPEKPRGPGVRMDHRTPDRKDVSNAWNFDFDDNESDGADVASFEYADSHKLDEDFSLGKQALHEVSRGYEDGSGRSNRPPKGVEREYSDPGRSGIGFNDFDEDEDDDVDSYEVVSHNEAPRTPRIDFSELEADSESEDVERDEGNRHARGRNKFPTRQTSRKKFVASEDDEVDFDTDDDLPIHPNWKSTHVANRKQQSRDRTALTFGSDDDLDDSDSDDETLRSKTRGNRRGGGAIGVERRSGGRSRFKADSFSDDDLSYQSDKRRNKSCPNRPGNGFNRNDSFNRSSGPRQNSGGFREKSFNGPAKIGRDSKFGSHRQGEKSFNREAKNSKDGKMSKFGRDRQGGSFDKRRSYDNPSDSYLEDERYRRPRANVR